VLEIDAASNRKVEDVEPLIDAARYLPQRSPRKIFIVDEAHMLSKHAWNALLKTLEEPPPHVLFIFATTEPQKVIETVRSRCQCFDFRRITAADIQGKLRKIAEAEGVEVGEGVLEEIAGRATGGLRDAESLFDQLLSAAPAGRAVTLDDLVALIGDTPRELRAKILGHAHRGALAETLLAAREVVAQGADPSGLLRDLYADLHDAAVSRAQGEAGDPPLEWCLAAAEIIGRHIGLAERSRAPAATLDLGLLAVARLGDVRDLEEMAQRLERLAGGAPAPVSPPARAPATPREAPTPSPGAPSRLTLKAARPEPGVEPSAAAPENVEAPPAAPGDTLRGEELARVQALPRVREVLRAFGGHIEHIGRTQDGEAVR
jgi:DNA polymerase-3 subunit gamma/tau